MHQLRTLRHHELMVRPAHVAEQGEDVMVDAAETAEEIKDVATRVAHDEVDEVVNEADQNSIRRSSASDVSPV